MKGIRKESDNKKVRQIYEVKNKKDVTCLFEKLIIKNEVDQFIRSSLI
jgi:hypothetical protein